jgi:toxin CcdB
MPQFSVHRNKNPKTKGAYPYLVDVQSDLLRDLRTRVVVPLTKYTAIEKKAIKALTPLVEIDGHKYVMMIPQLAGILSSELGAEVCSFAQHRSEIIAALDFLATGI